MSATTEQMRIAAALGLDISRDTELVAAARISDEVANATGIALREAATEKQLSYASSLGLDVSGDSKRVARFRIKEVVQQRELEALKRLNLKPGDHVSVSDYDEVTGKMMEDPTEYVVSSIGDDCIVYFKGSNTRRASPTQIKKMK